MSLEQLANIAEIVGNLMVVISLIYLSLQMRQGAATLKSESRQAQLTTDQSAVYLFVEHPELQFKSGALDEEMWLSYRDVIYFVLGTQRTRALWELCSIYFNPEFVAMIHEMINDVPETDFWQKLESVT
jgi:hypothetical protein